MVASAIKGPLQGETYPMPPTQQQGQPTGGTRALNLLNCKQEGYWSKECPKKFFQECAHVVKRWGTERGSAFSSREERELPFQRQQAL